MNNSIIKIKNLDFYFGRKHVLRDINVEFERNHITAIIGPSGSGKSTLLRTLNRIYELYPGQQALGEIYLHNENILHHQVNLNALRRHIGMVMQKPTPFPMTIFENVAFAIRLHEKLTQKELVTRVEQALHQAALWSEVKERLHSAATQLSGGQQQRLCIARAIAIRPQVLLLDEPTSALDPIAIAKIEDLILKLKQKYTIILVTHNLKQAQRLSDTTVYLEEGQIIEMAPTKDFFANPKHPQTKHYIEIY